MKKINHVKNILLEAMKEDHSWKYLSTTIIGVSMIFVQELWSIWLAFVFIGISFILVIKYER